ncbi:MAG: hypothetical protein ACE5NC_02935 [Anaerolineae bacterium]
MEIESFPGPKTGSRIGFVMKRAESTDSSVRGQDRARRWAEAGIGWVTLESSVGHPIPSDLVTALTRQGIEPVLALDRSPVSEVDQRALRTTLDAYAVAGGRYLYLYRYPNLAGSWDSARWSEPELVRRFMGILRPSLARAIEAGLIPLLPPLQPGGDYWDTAFLAESLEILMEEDPGLLESIGVATVTPLDRDLNWGTGGPTRWPLARPYHTPPGSQDHRGFRIFAWYDEIIKGQLGRSLPLVAVTSYPAVGGPMRRTAEAAAMARRGSLPRYLLCVNLGPLEAQDGTPMPAVRMMAEQAQAPSDEVARTPETELPPQNPQRQQAPMPSTESEPVPDPWSEPSGEPPPSNGSIQHYVLFPTWDFGVSDWYWRMATKYVRAFRPACGFQPDEAGLARYVTIIGDERGVSAATEEELVARGCRVERIAGDDAESTRRILENMVRQGREFLSWEETEWS